VQSYFAIDKTRLHCLSCSSKFIGKIIGFLVTHIGVFGALVYVVRAAAVRTAQMSGDRQAMAATDHRCGSAQTKLIL